MWRKRKEKKINYFYCEAFECRKSFQVTQFSNPNMSHSNPKTSKCFCRCTCSLYLWKSRKDTERQSCTIRLPPTDMYLPLASAPPSWSHLYEPAEQAQSASDEPLLPGNLKTPGDWGWRAVWGAGKVKWSSGESEVFLELLLPSHQQLPAVLSERMCDVRRSRSLPETQRKSTRHHHTCCPSQPSQQNSTAAKFSIAPRPKRRFWYLHMQPSTHLRNSIKVIKSIKIPAVRNLLCSKVTLEGLLRCHCLSHLGVTKFNYLTSWEQKRAPSCFGGNVW